MHDTNEKIYSTNFLLLLFVFFLYTKVHIDNVKLKKQIHCSVFFLPIKKKSVIFLRAPYKNKLARLNILNLEYTSIISFKNTHAWCNVNHNAFISHLKNNTKNFSTQKIKHTKTKIYFNTKYEHNFNINYFLKYDFK